MGPYIPKLYARELRQEAKLSMVDVLERMAAKGVVMTEASLSRIERSLQPADTPTLYALADVLGVPISTLMTGIRPDPEGVDRLYERMSPRDRAVTKRMMQDMAAAADQPPAGKGPRAKRRDS